MAAYYWVDSETRSVFPTTAIEGGRDLDGSTLYVGRAYHEGDWIPAKIIPQKHAAYVSYGGLEHLKTRYQVLCQQRFDWVPSHDGLIPPGAVEGGRTRSGEILYVGRAYHKGAPTIGKVHPSHRTCYIPFDGKEIPYRQYEIMVLRS
ncbi:natterin-3 [Anoplophora glabripennis]|uniref:Uncharacterized protein n=1 Tax=Anoplophora glabripennis TaxID=217634 RepID=V5GTT6_ANOGL|nr:natterin-3 [Anoplophora glabripennis]